MVYVSKLEQLSYLCKKQRLENFPSGVKLYSKSKNCVAPKAVKLSVKQFEDLTKSMKCVHSSARTLYLKNSVNGETRAVNHFIYKKFIKKKGN